MRLISPSDVPTPIGAYSALFELDLSDGGRLVTFSGLVGVDDQGDPASDIVGQLGLVFAGIDQILRHYDATRADVGKLLTFLRADVPFQTYSAARTRIYDEWYPHGVYPAHSLALVAGLAGPDLLVEVEGMLVAPGS